MSYDKNNIFAKILRNEIPCKKIFENKYVLSFYDINPQKKIHALIIPKNEYINLDDFNQKASDQEIVALSKAITEVANIRFEDVLKELENRKKQSGIEEKKNRK